MRPRTLAALGFVVLVAGGLAIGAVTVDHRPGIAPVDHRPGVDMEPMWIGDTARDTGGNHHAPAAGRVQGAAMVYAPLSGRPGSSNCALVALDGSTGAPRWRHPIPASNCTVHSVADPTLADFDGDGVAEVVATTTERAVAAHHPLTGAIEFRHDLASYGYTAPVVADLAGDDRPEIVVVDARGTIYVLRPDGTTVFTKRLDTYTWGQPAVADFDGDGAPELAVGLGGAGDLHVFEGNGSMAWDHPVTFGSSITWMRAGQGDDDAAVELVVATASSGIVSVVDGARGEREWTRDLGRFAAVHAFGDGDGDGEPEIYAVARDAKLRSLAADTGATEWTTALTTAPVQMTPPPALGDVDGDGAPELVAVANDGSVSVLDPASGTVLDSYERDAAVYARPRLADVDGDGDFEAFVTYADGRVVALDFG